MNETRSTGNILVVIDMQNDFVTPGGSLFINDSLITLKVAKHIDTYYEQYERVIFTKDCHSVNDPEFINYPEHCVKDTQGYQLNPIISLTIQECLKDKHIIVDKSIFSAADKIDNLIQLNHITNLFGKNFNVNTITVIGVCTNICVLHTVAGLVFCGYKIRVIDHLTSSYDTKLHYQAINHMCDILKIKII